MQEADRGLLRRPVDPRQPADDGRPRLRGHATQRGATTGAEEIVCDGMVIDSPEAVVEHLERFEFPRLRQRLSNFDEDGARARRSCAGEAAVQQELIGPNMLKSGYGFISFPGFAYGTYGYENYFMAYALYPEVMERHFALQADSAFAEQPRRRARLSRGQPAAAATASTTTWPTRAARWWTSRRSTGSGSRTSPAASSRC